MLSTLGGREGGQSFDLGLGKLPPARSPSRPEERMSDTVGPQQNNAGASSNQNPEYDEGWGTFGLGVIDSVTDMFDFGEADPAADQRSYTSTTIEEAPNYTPLAIGLAVGAVALAFALR